jgi:hypothetical protein
MKIPKRKNMPFYARGDFLGLDYLTKRRVPGKYTATVTRMTSCTTSFEVSFVIRLNSITFRALLTNPLLVITVLPSKVLLYANKIS